MTDFVVYLLLLAVGFSLGSFVNVLVYRLPREEEVIFSRSRCPSCGSFLRWFDLIPLFSFFLLRGSCRYCGKTISWRYPAVEAGTAILVWLVFWQHGISWALASGIILVPILLAAALIDLELYIIPNFLIVLGLAGGALFHLVLLRGEQLLNGLLGALAAAGLFLLLYIVSRGGMGEGDIKLAAVGGLFLGWPQGLVAMLLACFIAGITGIFLLASGRKKRKDMIPFGPFISLGTYIVLLWGEEIMQGYLHWIGLG